MRPPVLIWGSDWWFWEGRFADTTKGDVLVMPPTIPPVIAPAMALGMRRSLGGEAGVMCCARLMRTLVAVEII